MTTENNAAPRGLLPCPFCGGHAEIETIEKDCFGVGCPNCDFQLMNGPWAIGWHRSKLDATTEWNRRTPNAAEQAEQRMSDAGRSKRHWNPVYNTDPVQRACGELPDGWEIEIALEKDAGCIAIIDPDGERIQVDNDGDCWDWYVHAAIDEVFECAARKADSIAESERGDSAGGEA